MLKKRDKIVALANGSYMNNAKWRCLFSIIHELSPSLMDIAIKLVDEDEDHLTYLRPNPSVNDILDKCLSDRYCYLEYKYIEWLLIPAKFENQRGDLKRPIPALENDILGFLKVLDQCGKFCIEHTDLGIKIIGYRFSEGLRSAPSHN